MANAKFQDIFQQNGMWYPMAVGEIKMNVETKFGTKHLVTMIHSGVAHDWFVSPPTFQKLFVDNGIREGVVVEVQCKRDGNKTIYDLRASTGEQMPAAPMAGKETPNVFPAPSNNYAEERNKAEELKQNRISIAGYLQALITSGKGDIESCKALALELVRWAKRASTDLYNEEHEDEVNL